MSDKRPNIRIHINHAVLPAPSMSHLGGLPLEPPLAITISQAEQDWQAAMRRRSYELAIARGHIRR